MSYECDNDNHEIGCQCPGRSPRMTDDELRAWFRYIEYQNRLIIWMIQVTSSNPKSRPPQPKPPNPPEGIVQ